MASAIEICNLALNHIGANSIQSFDSPTKEARTCKLLYATLRDETLSDHDWNFARKRISLALSTEEFSEWSYAYQWPTDCLVIRKIVNTSSSDSVDRTPYEVGANSGGNRKLILCDAENAELVYTARIEDANMYDTLFIKALSYRLAMDLAQPLRGKPEIRNLMYQSYAIQISTAKAVSGNQGQQNPDNSNAFTKARE